MLVWWRERERQSELRRRGERGGDEKRLKGKKKKKKKKNSPDVERFVLAFVLVASSLGREIVRSKRRAKHWYSPDPVAGPEGQGREHCLKASSSDCLVDFNSRSGDSALSRLHK